MNIAPHRYLAVARADGASQAVLGKPWGGCAGVVMTGADMHASKDRKPAIFTRVVMTPEP